MGEADGQEGKSKVGGGEEGGCGKWWMAVSVVDWGLADESMQARRFIMGDATGQDLLESKDEVVEMLDGQLGHC